MKNLIFLVSLLLFFSSCSQKQKEEILENYVNKVYLEDGIKINLIESTKNNWPKLVIENVHQKNILIFREHENNRIYLKEMFFSNEKIDTMRFRYRISPRHIIRVLVLESTKKPRKIFWLRSDGEFLKLHPYL